MGIGQAENKPENQQLKFGNFSYIVYFVLRPAGNLLYGA
jgi:hypothetical protein